MVPCWLDVWHWYVPLRHRCTRCNTSDWLLSITPAKWTNQVSINLASTPRKEGREEPKFNPQEPRFTINGNQFVAKSESVWSHVQRGWQIIDSLQPYSLWVSDNVFRFKTMAPKWQCGGLTKKMSLVFSGVGWLNGTIFAFSNFGGKHTDNRTIGGSDPNDTSCWCHHKRGILIDFAINEPKWHHHFSTLQSSSIHHDSLNLKHALADGEWKDLKREM